MSQKLFVGGLPFSTSTEELGQLFNQVYHAVDQAIPDPEKRRVGLGID